MKLQIYNDLNRNAEVKSLPKGAIPLSEILKILEVMKDIDWKSIIKLIENEKQDIATLTTIEDLLKIASVFVPQAAIAVGVIEVLLIVLNNSNPTSPYEIRGYHWDMLEGWVKDQE